MSAFDRVYLKIFQGEEEPFASSDLPTVSTIDRSEGARKNAKNSENADENENGSEIRRSFLTTDGKPLEIDDEKDGSTESPQTLVFEDYLKRRLESFSWNEKAELETTRFDCGENERDRRVPPPRFLAFKNDSRDSFGDEIWENGDEGTILKLNDVETERPEPNAIIIPMNDKTSEISEEFSTSNDRLEITLDSQDDFADKILDGNASDFFLSDSFSFDRYPATEPVEQTNSGGRTNRETFGTESTVCLKETLSKRLPGVCDEMVQQASSELAALGDSLYEEMQSGRKIISFNSVSSQSGCSVMLLGVAGELISRGLSVLLIDANFENPSLASLLGLDVRNGWENSVLNNRTLDSDLIKIQILKRDERNDGLTSRSGESFLYLLPLAFATAFKAIKASFHQELKTSIGRLAEEFDFVLLDSGRPAVSPEETASEMNRFGIDGYYLIQDIRKNEQEKIRRIVVASSRHNVCCLGVIENFV